MTDFWATDGVLNDTDAESARSPINFPDAQTDAAQDNLSESAVSTPSEGSFEGTTVEF